MFKVMVEFLVFWQSSWFWSWDFLKELHVILPSEGAARKHLLALSSFHTTCEFQSLNYFATYTLNEKCQKKKGCFL
jgi:hypothetical protein